MTPYYADEAVTLHHGDALEVLRSLPDASVDAVCTDPPYGLEFMGREWDSFKPSAARLRTRVDGRTNPAEGKSVTTTPEAYVAGVPFQRWCEAWAVECLRVLKPGGWLLAFGGTRTVHRLTCGVEDAGFEIRDGIDWLYGSGFPKSLDVSKAIDKAAGAERAVIGTKLGQPGYSDSQTTGRMLPTLTSGGTAGYLDVTAPATDDARRWSGWGTALKPAREPIVMARKPLAGTVAANVLAYGTGALNIDACRVPAGQDYRDKCASVVGLDSNRNGDAYGEWSGVREDSAHADGRWPSNVVLSHAPLLDDQGEIVGDACADGCVPGCPVAELDRQSGTSKSASGTQSYRRVETTGWRERGGSFTPGREWSAEGYADSGGASRFFPVFRYEAKAPTAERPRTTDGTAHPTVKPLGLMRWLVRLVTPAGGVVLEPFAGSGTTAEACVLEGFRCIAIEREAAYLPLIVARLTKPLQPSLDLFGGAA